MSMRRALVLGSFLTAAALTAVPATAHACGMYRMPTMRVKPPQADDLLAKASRKIDAGDWAGASSLANRVAESGLARPDQRARALAIVGWSAWQFGAKARALSAFKRARAFDREGGQVDTVLARVKHPEKLAALRSALEA